MARSSNRPDDLPYLFPKGPFILPVSTWADGVQQYHPMNECRVIKVSHCKEKKQKGHEFLLVHAVHLNSDADVYFALDRVPSEPTNDESSIRMLDGIAIASSFSVTAADSIILSQNGTKSDVTNKFSSFKTLCTIDYLTGEAPTVTQLSIILDLLSKHIPDYQLYYESQCYWFASTIWETLTTLFPDGETAQYSRSASSYQGFKIPMDKSAPAIIAKYEIEWARLQRKAAEVVRAQDQLVKEIQDQVLKEAQEEIKRRVDEARENARNEVIEANTRIAVLEERLRALQTGAHS